MDFKYKLEMMCNRIVSIDMPRGFSLLGILIMNMVSFAMPRIAYFSPVAYEAIILNQVIYCISHVIADQKFMAIFFMFFGVSANLSINNLIKRGQKPIILFYSRNFWLFIIGWPHSHFIWHGDILVVYALCSFFLFLFKNFPPRLQFSIRLLIYLIPSLIGINNYYKNSELDQVNQYAIQEYWNPDNAKIKEELDIYRGSYKEQLNYRTSMYKTSENGPNNFVVISLVLDFFSRSFGMMLIGMSLYNWAIFSGLRKESFYKKMVFYGFEVSLPISVLGLSLSYFFEWNWMYSQFLGRIPNTIATPFIFAGYISLIILWSRKEFLKIIKKK